MENNLCNSCNSNYNQLYTDSFLDCLISCPEGYINIEGICELYTIITTEMSELFTEKLSVNTKEISNNINCDNSPYILVGKGICLEHCNGKDFLNQICKSINNSLIIKMDIINNIRADITNGNLSSLLLNILNNENVDKAIYDNDIIYQITSTSNSKNNQYNNISIIKLLECEKRLKEHNGINKTKSLIIFKVDIYEESLIRPIVIYELYNPDTFQRLELDICLNISIEIDLPVSINEKELFKYDPSSEFYNDKCFPYTSENGTDVTLKDRQNEYANNNLSLCEDNCTFLRYNNFKKYAICDCKVKNYINITKDLIIDKDRLLNSFIDIKNMINLEVLKCYYILFTKDGIIKNIGSYILLFTICFFIISAIIFIGKGYKSLISEINNLILKYTVIPNKSIYSPSKAFPEKGKKRKEPKKNIKAQKVIIILKYIPQIKTIFYKKKDLQNLKKKQKTQIFHQEKNFLIRKK